MFVRSGNIQKYLIDNKYITSKNETINISSVNIYNTLFKTEYFSQLECRYGTDEYILTLFNYFELISKINNNIDDDIINICNKKMSNSKNDTLSDAYNTYCKLFDISPNIKPFLIFMKKMKYTSDTFDTNIKKWIHMLTNESLQFIVDVYYEHSDEIIIYECDIEYIYDIFGKNEIILINYLDKFDYTQNKKLFFDIINDNINIINNKVIQNKIDDIVNDHMKYTIKNIDGSSYNVDIFVNYLMLKFMSTNIKITSICKSLKIMDYITINNKFFNDFILSLKNDIDNYFAHDYLFKICSLFTKQNNKDITYQQYKNEWIKIFLENGFAIFPCNLDKTPMIKRWNKITINDSYKLYTPNSTDDDSKDYTFHHKTQYIKNNIGVLCGIQSRIIVIDIDIKDGGIQYWNNMLMLNDCNSIDTLKVISGSGGFHYYFKWTPQCKKWFSKNRMFSTNECKVGIDLRADNGYIILPPSIHHDTQNLYKFDNINSPCNLRDKINEMPKWLFNKINNYFHVIEEKKPILQFKKFDIKKINMRSHKKLLGKMSDHFKTYELCKNVVTMDEFSLKWVPIKHRTFELCKIAVTHNGSSLKYVPIKHRTLELCKIAVSKYGGWLQYVPIKHKIACESEKNKSSYELFKARSKIHYKR
jgi:hypothetical protein